MFPFFSPPLLPGACYYGSMVWRGWRKSLSFDHLCDLNYEDKSRVVAPKFLREWNKELRNAGWVPFLVLTFFRAWIVIHRVIPFPQWSSTFSFSVLALVSLFIVETWMVSMWSRGRRGHHSCLLCLDPFGTLLLWLPFSKLAKTCLVLSALKSSSK